MSERHAHESFYYDIPIVRESQYVLILNFAEVYLKNKRCISTNQKKEYLMLKLEIK